MESLKIFVLFMYYLIRRNFRADKFSRTCIYFRAPYFEISKTWYMAIQTKNSDLWQSIYKISLRSAMESNVSFWKSVLIQIQLMISNYAKSIPFIISRKKKQTNNIFFIAMHRAFDTFLNSINSLNHSTQFYKITKFCLEILYIPL